MEIYIELVGEGTVSWRPAQAEVLPDGSYRVLGPVPDDETWAHPPGSIVRSQMRVLSVGEVLVAVQRSDAPNPTFQRTALPPLN